MSNNRVLLVIMTMLLTACNSVNAGSNDSEIISDVSNTLDEHETDDFVEVVDPDDTSNFEDSDFKDENSYDMDVDSVDDESLCSGDFPNYHKGMCWSDTYEKWLSHYDAFDYCASLGGRLPTVSELRTLIQNCPPTETGGTCGVTDDCLEWTCSNDACHGCVSDGTGKYSVFGDRRNLWSSNLRIEDSEMAWIIYFGIAVVGGADRDSCHDVRCLPNDEVSDNNDEIDE